MAIYCSTDTAFLILDELSNANSSKNSENSTQGFLNLFSISQLYKNECTAYILKTNVKSQDDKILALNVLCGVSLSLTWVIPSQNDLQKFW